MDGAASWPGYRRHYAAGISVGDLHYAGADAVPLHLGRIPGPDLQDDAGRQGNRHAGQNGPSTQTVRLDSRDGLSVGKRAICSRALELARAEVVSPSE